MISRKTKTAHLIFLLDRAVPEAQVMRINEDSVACLGTTVTVCHHKCERGPFTIRFLVGLIYQQDFSVAETAGTRAGVSSELLHLL